MPTYRITDPVSGKTLNITGDRRPTESELRQIFRPYRQEANQPQPVEELAREPDMSAVEAQAGFGEAALSALSGMAAEVPAGLAGIAAQAVPGGRTGGEMVQDVREALTYQPRTEAGREALGSLTGGFIGELGEGLESLENTLGQAAFDATGSPAVAAAAETVPTAIMELLGFGAGRGVSRAGRAGKQADVNTMITEVAPSQEQLRTASNQIYRELDDMGVTVEPTMFRGLVDDIAARAEDMGIDVDSPSSATPKASRALTRLQNALENPNISLTELNRLRRVASNTAQSADRTESALGSMMVGQIDEFLNNLDVSSLQHPAGVNIGNRYNIARQLWGRARRSERIQDAIQRAKDSRGSFDNALRSEMRRILRSPRERRFFSDQELDIIRGLAEGDFTRNLSSLLGRFAYTAENALLPTIPTSAAAAIGGSLGGPLGATLGAGGVIGTTWGASKLARFLADRGADFTDAVIRAGTDSNNIIRTYLNNTSKASRSSDELAELLLGADDLSQDFARRAGQDRLVREAINKARERQAALGSAAFAGAASQNESGPVLSPQEGRALAAGSQGMRARAFQRIMEAGQGDRLRQGNPEIYRMLEEAFNAQQQAQQGGQ